MTEQRVRADATVEPLGHRQFSVVVQGLLPHLHKRHYLIAGLSDDAVAFEGIRRFTDEMESLYAGDLDTDGHASAPDPAPTAT